MNKFLRFSLVSITLMLLPYTAPQGGLKACWFGFEHDKTNYRFWLFQPDLVPSKAMQLLSYPDLTTEFDGYDYKGGRRVTFNAATDTSFYAQNVAEWQNALKAETALKASKNVKATDIHSVLYNLNPEDFFRKMMGDSLKNNTFIRSVSQSPSLLNYLNFAKICEQLMNFDDPWEAYSEGKDVKALRKYQIIGDSVLQQKTLSAFVKYRMAFQMVKMAHYLGDTARVTSLYHRFFEKTHSKSWVVASAGFYYAMAQADVFKRNYLLSKTFENSIDKKWRSLQLFENNDSILSGSLALAKNAHERTTILILPILTHTGRQLPKLKVIYAIDPNHPLFMLAVQREINKVEDWIYTNRFTEFSSSSTDDDYDLDEKRRESGMTQQDIDVQNLRSDKLYMDVLQQFITQVAAEKRQHSMAFWELAVAHLAFLKKDFSTAKQHLANAKIEKNTPLSIQTQIWLIELLCDLYETEHITTETEFAILKFDNFLKNQKTQLLDYTTFRSQIMRFLSERFIADGKIAKGILILSKSTLTFGTIRNMWEKNFYHKLLEIGSPQDFNQVLDIVNRKPRRELSDFERWLASEPKEYESPMGCRGCFSDSWDAPPPPKRWNISKLKDYQSILYVNRDELDSAYTVLRAVPDTFWRQYPYSEYMTEDPFKPDLSGRAWNKGVWDDSTETYILPNALYTKPQFLKRLIQLKKQVEVDPVLYNKNYYLIGSAYFNMTQHGKFWLMSQIWWDGNYEGNKRTNFNDKYYGCTCAIAWFAKGVKQSKDEKLAALCCFMANECQHFQDEYLYELKYGNRDYDKRPEMKTRETPLWRDLRSRFKGARQYENVDYWCQNFEIFAAKYR